MAHFLYKGTYTGANKCFRIVNADTGLMWNNKTTVKAMASPDDVDNAAYADGNVPLLYDDGIPGYLITIPSELPCGDYDLHIYGVASTEATVATAEAAYETGFGFSWSGSHLTRAPRQLTTDRSM